MKQKEDITNDALKEEHNNCTCDEDCSCDEECTCDEDCSCEDKSLNDEEKPKEKKKPKKDKVKDLENKVKELSAKTLLKEAELINYRKRKDEELSRMLKYSNEDLVKEILPVLDNFERAINMDDDKLNDEVSKFLSGFKMIYCHLKDSLIKYEVVAIDGNNKPFDPTYHQAVLTEKSDSLKPGMIIEVMQKGYLLKDKVIRPAMVRVSE
ncbi:MAG: nucleotide exchange factor GrpE [Bacilli bacterium]